MPPKTPRQQRFMGADLSRARSGKPTKTGMGAGKLADFATKPKGGFPGKAGNGRNGGRNARR